MEDVIEMKAEKANFRPSLLRQIVDEVDTLNIDEQQNLLRHIRLEKLAPKFKALDKQLENNTITLTEDDIADLVSNDRKKDMKKKFVLDTSVFLIYASYNKLYRLLDAVRKYDLVIYTNEELLAEILRNLPQVIKVDDITPQDVIGAIKNLSEQIATDSVFDSNPDPKGNFLFDIAMQTGSEVIVTQEKALLSFIESPVLIHNLKWFKETYPVPL